jgi:hypothetical protein
MDFLYRARMPQLDEKDLAALDEDLREFHEVKAIFRTEGALTSKYGFNNLAKLHILRHYSHTTREMGTPDGFTTETPERLHKDYVKVSYHASNGVVPEPQMLTHLRRQEAWQLLRAKYEREGLVERRKRRGRLEEEPVDFDQGINQQHLMHEYWASEEGVSVDEGEDEDEDGSDEGGDAEQFEAEVGGSVGRNMVNECKDGEAYQFASQTYIAKRPLHVTATWNRTPLFLPTVIAFVHELDRNLAFHLNENTRIGLWSKFSIRHDPLPFAPLVGRRVDLVRAAVARRTAGGQITRPAVFDTVLVEAYPDMIGLLREYSAFIHIFPV